MKKKKILILYNFLLHYRIPFVEKLASLYDVTILHSGMETNPKEGSYKEIIVPVKKLGPIYYQTKVLKEVRRIEYDVIITLFDLRWINSIIAFFLRRRSSQFIWWGAWITKLKIANTLRIVLTKLADANVFYTYSALKDFVDCGVSEESLYVANNTFDVKNRIRSYEYNQKDKIIFVGSLDPRKQNNVLIKAFSEILKYIPRNIKLIIIGDGIEKKILEKQVENLGITDRVSFVGRINDTKELINYYKEAIVSVSFGQAGLSVLQSLGYGVPFMTKRNAITGGEITNLKDRYNGILCDDDIESLKDNLIELCNKPMFSKELGVNAFNYYNKYCTIDNMANGFVDAIEGTNFSNIDYNLINK